MACNSDSNIFESMSWVGEDSLENTSKPFVKHDRQKGVPSQSPVSTHSSSQLPAVQVKGIENPVLISEDSYSHKNNHLYIIKQKYA